MFSYGDDEGSRGPCAEPPMRTRMCGGVRREGERATRFPYSIWKRGWTHPSARPALRGRTGDPGQPASAAGQGTTDLQAASPAIYGSKRKSQINSICDHHSSLGFTSAQNRSSSGYELQPGGGGLKQDFQKFEGTIRGSVSSSPTRLIRKCNSKDTS
jgi:hypothetical protein